MTDAALFNPWTIRGVTARNRVMVSPMCMYSARDGLASPYHLVHLGRFALGGAGIVMVEATAVEPRGRISHHDLGLWSDEQADALAPVAAFLAEYGAVPAIQLGHAGRKAGTRVPWEGGKPLRPEDGERGESPWTVVAPTAEAAGPGWQTPEELTLPEIAQLVDRWRDAAVRAVRAGFRILELHGAHGYLLHSFQSPISNRRTDAYGGDPVRRMRFPLEVLEAVRAAVPDDVAIFYRVSSVDGVEGGLTIEDTVAFAKELHLRGVDVVDTSSGGVVTDRRVDTRVRRGYGFHTPFSRAVREQAGVPTVTVGLVVDPRQAEEILARGDADAVALGREMLADPSWPHHARLALEDAGYESWHAQAGFWLQGRMKLIAGLSDEGETPLSRYLD